MENVRQSSGITFDIVLEENVAKPEPKRMLLLKNRQNAKEPLTAGEIEKKQRLAEERRQARIKARLKRMHEREESTRKLVQSLDVLQQQQSLRTGQLQNSGDVPIMSQQEIFKTANDVVKRFKDMQRQLLNMDLKIDGQKNQAGHFPETRLQKASKTSQKEKTTLQKMAINFNPDAKVKQKPEGIAFEIPFDDSGCSKQCKKKPAIATLQKKRTAANRDLVALKLEEKQWKAAESRQRRQNEKVRRIRERREALMELQTKVNIFRQHQAALEGQADPGMILPEHEAACLAHDIADGFSYIHARYKADLERAEGFFMVYDKTL